MKAAPEIAARLARLGVAPEEIEERFSRASGPGGQHVNKVSTAVTLRHLPSGLAVTASERRSQLANRQLALERLIEALERRRRELRQEEAAARSKTRRQRARRSRGTKARMLEGKRRRGEIKKLRGRVE